MNNFITLAGVLLGGVVATFAAYYSTTKRDQVLFMRKKIEELYLAVESFDRSLGSHFITGYPLIKGEISWNDFLDLQIKNADKNDRDASIQVSMLFDLYFSSLQPAFRGYLEYRDILNQILADHKRDNKAGRTETDYFKPFHRAMVEFDTKSKELKQAIVAEAQRYARVNLWPWHL